MKQEKKERERERENLLWQGQVPCRGKAQEKINLPHDKSRTPPFDSDAKVKPDMSRSSGEADPTQMDRAE